MAADLIACYHCRHYFVSWDERFPHGCRRMGFKSWMQPCAEVRRTMSGRDCLLFEAKSESAARREYRQAPPGGK